MLFFILLIGYVLFIVWILNSNKSVKNQSEYFIVQQEKVCPPHKWRYGGYTDADGEFIGHIQCEICKVFPGYTDKREVL